MSDFNLMKIIVIIIAVLLIGILLVIPIGGSNKNDKSSITINETVKQETLATKDSNSTTEGKEDVAIRFEEKEALNDGNISVKKIISKDYYIDGNLGATADIYNGAIEKMMSCQNISCYGYLNGKVVLIEKLDLDNLMNYIKMDMGISSIDCEFYTICTGDMVSKYMKRLENGNWYGTGHSESQMLAEADLVGDFLSFVIGDKLSSRYGKVEENYTLSDEEYDINGFTCYKISGTASNNYQKSVRDYYISKDLDLFIRTDIILSDGTLEVNFGYNTDPIELPEHLKSMINN